MLELLDRQEKLTGHQRMIVGAAIIGDMLEFFDYFIMGFVLAFIVTPWNLTFLESAIILLSSGIGAIVGAYFWGGMADKVGRRLIFMATVITFAHGRGILALTPDRGWVFLAFFRALVGFGVGGLYSVDLPLVQEFVPASKRGMIGGLVTVFIPVGNLLGSVLGAYLAPLVGWRGLFLIGALPALFALVVRAWVPESPRWLIRMGRPEEARRSVAWALEMDPNDIPLPSQASIQTEKASWSELFSYKRSLAVSWLGNLGLQTGSYGLYMWGPTLLAQILKVAPQQASFLYIFVTLGGLVGRVAFSFLSEMIGRRASGGLLGFGAAIMVVLTAVTHDAFIGSASVFWLMMIITYFFADGGFAIVGPYGGEVWPARLRTSGMGSAYGFGGIGKIIGPLGLALVVGSSNVVTPAATTAAIVPAFVYLSAWFLFAGLVFLVLGIETKGKSLEELESLLARMAGKKAEAAVSGAPR